MPTISSPIPDCGYSTDNVEAIAAAAQLNIHALIHCQDGSGPGSTKQKPPKIECPVVSRGSTEEEWHTFLKRWNLFKQGTDIPQGQVTTHLWKCCDKDLEDDLFKDIDDIGSINEETLLASIK